MGSCDNRCTSGQEGTCRCSCGGDNHGTAKAAYDVVKSGGQAQVKGAGFDILLTKGEDGAILGTDKNGNAIGGYTSETEFVKELGALIRAGRVEVKTKDLNDKEKVIVAPKLTDKEAQKQIRALGAIVKRVDGEYKVNVPGGTEATAYYTDDKKDAVGTARAMMKQHAVVLMDQSDREYSSGNKEKAKELTRKAGRILDTLSPEGNRRREDSDDSCKRHSFGPDAPGLERCGNCGTIRNSSTKEVIGEGSEYDPEQFP